ncbi:hypothetical protein QCA50_005954 [Cerrena zonata]|uniref:Uncharacterized protein n=1 Tax=Cerrena zonata TaxID=2478898 RepID=A0AAW0GLP8_9APHY
MKSASALLFSVALATAALAQDLRIETPIGPVVCQPILLTWSGGTPPYFLPSAQPLEQFTNLQGTTFSWTVNQPAGTSLGLTLRDSTGATGQSAPFTINSGPDTSCLNATSSAGASSTSAGSSSAPLSSASSTAPGSSASTPASSAPATTPSATSTGTSSVSRTSTATSSSASASATGGAQNNGAENIAISGLTGLVAAFVAAIIA